MEKFLALTINIMMIMMMMTTMNPMMTLNVLSNISLSGNFDKSAQQVGDSQRQIAKWIFEREKLICIWWTFFYVAENISIIMQI